MSNEELPLSAEVASAYLDGELDATERAAASVDPDVMAEVESFARVRAALGEIEPVVASTKTAAIAAALAEFDAIHATPSQQAAAVAATTKVVSLQSRRMRTYRVLSRVAAVVVVGAVVVTALKASRGDDQDSSTSASDVPAAAQLPQTKAAGAIESATEAENDSAPAATEAPAATAAAADAGAAADSTAAAVPVIDTTEALEQFAADVESAPTESSQPLSAEAPPQYGSPSPGGYAPAACLSSDQVVLGSILFQGTPAFAVRDTSTGDLQAVDAGDCHVLVAVAGP